ncbi:uncharacterized protein LOC112688772 isoform X4 [Sipha flava]|uniref:Uncharacterized protein LOC112688772 isoform X4 n=1 Tax=Sipha flava TaxID=143950 RepID=A0A8B8G5P2_9HEMI|nr:uncharacterized protein LOC112688772 isoform X4 [Sipha flava]
MMTRMLRAQLIDGDVNVLQRVDYTGQYYWLPYFTVITVLVLASSDQRSDYATIVAHLLYFYPLRVVRLFISHMLCPVTDNVVGKRPPSIPRTSRKSVALLPIHRVERPTNLTFIRFLSATRTRIFLCFNVHQGSLGARTWIYLCFNLPHSADIFI